MQSARCTGSAFGAFEHPGVIKAWTAIKRKRKIWWGVSFTGRYF